MKFYINSILKQNIELLIQEVCRLYCKLQTKTANCKYSDINSLYTDIKSGLTYDEVRSIVDDVIFDMLKQEFKDFKDLKTIDLLTYEYDVCLKASNGKSGSSGGLNLPDIDKILISNGITPKGSGTSKRKQLFDLIGL